MKRMKSDMQDKEISLVLGTAGHIDHGKTTLIKALTGFDCDRLLQEKQRGITIELGFAPIKLPSHKIISVVDVPGHEKFIRQMVAGASGIDAVMLIVAADEGIMPQTREHIDILNLLGVKDGFVAVTKTDLVEKDLVDLAIEEIKDFLKGTFLDGCSVIPVSSTRGDNVPAIFDEIENLVERVETKDRKGPFFMPIDRAFPVSGFGTVVTGTAYAGKVRSGEDVTILPRETETRIRSIQVHSSDVNEGWAGQRIAMSLSGVSIDDLQRGDVVCEKGLYAPTKCFDANLRVLPDSPEPVKHWQRIRLHIGTSDVLARVSLFEDKIINPGESALVQIVAEEDIVAMISERFIIRFYSPLKTIGGGDVVFPYGKKPHGRKHRGKYIDGLAGLSRARTLRERISVLVDSFGKLEIGKLSLMVQEREQKVLSVAQKMHKDRESILIETSFKILFSRKLFEDISRGISDFLENYHDRFPHQKGAVIELIAENMKKTLEPGLIKPCIKYLQEENVLSYEEGFISLPSFVPHDEEQFMRDKESVETFCRGKAFLFPDLSEIRTYMKMDEKEFSDFIMHLKNMGELSIIQGNLVLHKNIEKLLLQKLSDIDGEILLSTVRDLTGSSRKYVLPVLEYFDSKGYTRRIGDKRILRIKNP